MEGTVEVEAPASSNAMNRELLLSCHPTSAAGNTNAKINTHTNSKADINTNTDANTERNRKGQGRGSGSLDGSNVYIGERVQHEHIMSLDKGASGERVTHIDHHRTVGFSEFSEAASQTSLAFREKTDIPDAKDANMARPETPAESGEREHAGEHVQVVVSEVVKSSDRHSSVSRSASATDVTSHATEKQGGNLHVLQSLPRENQQLQEQAELSYRQERSSKLEPGVARERVENVNSDHSTFLETNGARQDRVDTCRQTPSIAASSWSAHPSASSKLKMDSKSPLADVRARDQSTGSDAKRKVTELLASRFCHICQRKQGAVKHIVCSNIKQGSCRKVVCESCFEDNEWDFQRTLLEADTWACPHCLGLCPGRAQCKTYSKTNDRRRNGTLKPKKLKTEEIVPHGHSLIGAGSDLPVQAPFAQPQQPHLHRHEVHRSQNGAARSSQPMLRSAHAPHLPTTARWDSVAPHPATPAPSPYTGAVDLQSAGAFPIYYEYVYAPPQTEPLPKYSIFDGLPF